MVLSPLVQVKSYKEIDITLSLLLLLSLSHTQCLSIPQEACTSACACQCVVGHPPAVTSPAVLTLHSHSLLLCSRVLRKWIWMLLKFFPPALGVLLYSHYVTSRPSCLIICVLLSCPQKQGSDSRLLPAPVLPCVSPLLPLHTLLTDQWLSSWLEPDFSVWLFRSWLWHVSEWRETNIFIFFTNLLTNTNVWLEWFARELFPVHQWVNRIIFYLIRESHSLVWQN